MALYTSAASTGAPTPPYIEFNPAGVWPSTTFVTDNVSAPRLASSKFGETAPGLLFLSPFGNETASKAPTILAEDGTLVWQGPAATASNFDVQQVFGEPHLTYWSGYLDPTVGLGYGSVSILDSTYTETYTICGADLGLNLLGGKTYPCQLDAHDSFVTVDNTLLATAYNVTQANLSDIGGPEEGYLLDCLWFEIDIETEKVLRRWSSYEHLSIFPLLASHYPLNISGVVAGSSDNPFDYFHINAVSKLGDGYLVSSRHYFDAIYINKHGVIEWILNGDDGGDFDLPENSKFQWQHHVRGEVISDTEVHLHMFDNNDGLAGGPLRQSSGLLLSLDLETHQARLLRRLSDPQVTINSWHTGSYQPLPGGHVLLDYGQPPALQEFDAEGALVWTSTFGTESGVDSYRAFKRAWRGRPSAAPRVTAERGVVPGRDSTTVYVSWNGATEVASWALWAGHAEAGLRLVRKVAKWGFESKVTLRGDFKFVRAEALDFSGGSLGYSSVTLVDGPGNCSEVPDNLGPDEL